MSKYLQHAKRSNSMFRYPAKRNKSNVKFLAQTEAQEVLNLSEGCKKKKEDFDWFQCPWGPESLFRHPSPATVATTIQSTQFPFAVTSPTLLSNPYPQQDILRLAGIQCQYSLRPQPVVQTWKLHHWKKMVLFRWKAQHCRNTRQPKRPTQNSGLSRTFLPINSYAKM